MTKVLKYFFPGDAVDHHELVGTGGEFEDEVFRGLAVGGEFEGVGGEAEVPDWALVETALVALLLTGRWLRSRRCRRV